MTHRYAVVLDAQAQEPDCRTLVQYVVLVTVTQSVTHPVCSVSAVRCPDGGDVASERVFTLVTRASKN